ncbi:hypothetical protein DPMN_173002 [Dreissena polymorpha]|uniref:Uncharacterized protein n=1 Tax=Dreissena polymorpha TaxID=45954 RepID=A0A9D4E496_DREPO|nr:hypothetical protein DPMN_173002 [Dreissena polymorpha]
MNLIQKRKVGVKTGSKHPLHYIRHSVITERIILELQSSQIVADTSLNKNISETDGCSPMMRFVNLCVKNHLQKSIISLCDLDLDPS